MVAHFSNCWDDFKDDQTAFMTYLFVFYTYVKLVEISFEEDICIILVKKYKNYDRVFYCRPL